MPLAGQRARASDVPPTDRYSAILRETAAQSIGNNSITAVTFSIEDYDPGAGHTGSGSVWTAPVDGLYDVTAVGGVAANATGRVELRIAVNGTGVALVQRPNSTTAAADQSIGTLLSLLATDTVSMTLLQNSGGALNTTVTGGNPRLTIALLVQL
jgi:hypothetical protein